MKEYLDNKEGDINEMIEMCKKLFEKTSQLIIASEKKVGRTHYKNGKDSSPILTEAAKDKKQKRNLKRFKVRQRNTVFNF